MEWRSSSALRSVNKCIHIRRHISQREVSWEKYLLQSSEVIAKPRGHIRIGRTLKHLVFNHICRISESVESSYQFGHPHASDMASGIPIASPCARK